MFVPESVGADVEGVIDDGEGGFLQRVFPLQRLFLGGDGFRHRHRRHHMQTLSLARTNVQTLHICRIENGEHAFVVVFNFSMNPKIDERQGGKTDRQGLDMR